MSPGPEQEGGGLAAIRERIKNDLVTGQVLTLSEYLDAFPGEDPDHIRTTFASLCASEGDDPAGIWDPDEGQVGPYRIDEELGRGGQAVVYRAEDTRLKRQVALKVLQAFGPSSERLLKRFEREAELASRLQHPGICTIFDSGMTAGRPYIAMQLVDGVPLSFLLEQGEAPEPASLVHVFEKVARSLHVAHQAGVIHRDVKPSNIMLTDSGEPVILDFGIARPVDMEEAERLTMAGELFGTPAYMSPEQTLGSAVRLDGRTDVFSLGVSLYECLTGRLPFHAPTHVTLFQKIQTKEPLDPRALNSEVTEDLRCILETALAKLPEHRYRSALAFAEDLARVREHRPVSVRRAGPWLRLKRFLKREPRLAGAMLLVLLALLAGLVSTYVALEDTREERDRATVLADLVRLDVLDKLEAALWPASPDQLEGRKGIHGWLDMAGKVRDQTEDLERMLAKARAERVEDEVEMGWRRELLEWMAERLARLPDRIKSMEGQRDRLLALLGADEADGWRESRGFAAMEPRYAGVTPKTVPGLVPLGPDPESKLLEFGHLQTGRAPLRKGGKLQVTGETGLVFVLMPADPPAYVSKFRMTPEQWERCTGRSLRPAASSPPPGLEDLSWEEARVVLSRMGLTLAPLPAETRLLDAGVWPRRPLEP